MCLLCASLGWLEFYKAKLQAEFKAPDSDFASSFDAPNSSNAASSQNGWGPARGDNDFSSVIVVPVIRSKWLKIFLFFFSLNPSYMNHLLFAIFIKSWFEFQKLIALIICLLFLIGSILSLKTCDRLFGK